MSDDVRVITGDQMALHLGEFEQLVLLALVQLGENAYGVTVRKEIERRTGREVVLGSVYKTLGRLEAKGCVSSTVGQPTAERGGRRRRFYKILPVGVRALRQSLEALRAMSDGLEEDWTLP